MPPGERPGGCHDQAGKKREIEIDEQERTVDGPRLLIVIGQLREDLLDCQPPLKIEHRCADNLFERDAEVHEHEVQRAEGEHGGHHPKKRRL